MFVEIDGGEKRHVGSTKQALLAWTRNAVKRAEGRGNRRSNAIVEHSPISTKSGFSPNYSGLLKPSIRKGSRRFIEKDHFVWSGLFLSVFGHFLVMDESNRFK